MKTDEIAKLLERYERGETSLHEEEELIRFFTEEETPPAWQAEKAFFTQLGALRDEVPDGLETRLAALIDKQAEQERPATRRPLRLMRRQWMAGIAAGVCLLLGMGGYLYKQYTASTSVEETAELTPEEAYREAEKALLLFSTTLNKGLAKMEVIPQTTGKVQQNITEQLNKFKTIQP